MFKHLANYYKSSLLTNTPFTFLPVRLLIFSYAVYKASYGVAVEGKALITISLNFVQRIYSRFTLTNALCKRPK